MFESCSVWFVGVFMRWGDFRRFVFCTAQQRLTCSVACFAFGFQPLQEYIVAAKEIERSAKTRKRKEAGKQRYQAKKSAMRFTKPSLHPSVGAFFGEWAQIVETGGPGTVRPGIIRSDTIVHSPQTPCADFRPQPGMANLGPETVGGIRTNRKFVV